MNKKIDLLILIATSSGGSRILKRGGAEIFLGGGGRGRIFVKGGAADFERLYYQSRSDCTRPEAVMGVGAGGGPGILPPEIFFYL